MKKKNLNKIFSAFAVLAVSAGVICTVPFAACSKSTSDNGSGNGTAVGGNSSQKTVAVDTVFGTSQSRTNGKILFVSKDATRNDTTNCDGSLEKPYHIETVMDIVEASDSAKVIVEPGTTIAFLPGEYTGLTNSIHFRQSGAYNAYIEMRPATVEDGISPEQAAENGGKVLLNFSDMPLADSNRGIQLYSNYVYWHDIDVCGAGDNGIFVAGKYNTVENCDLYNNRDTGLQLGREASVMTNIDQWPAYNLIKNCSAHNNYDNGGTYGENADGFAAKLSLGYGNVFDGCIAYRNSDDGWDLYAYASNGNIGTVLIQNCVAYENGYLETSRDEYTSFFKYGDNGFPDKRAASQYMTYNGDGNGFKLGGSVMEGDVVLNNSMSFGNRMHGVTDNSNPGFLNITEVTSYDNSANINRETGKIIAGNDNASHANINVARQSYSYNNLNKVLSVKDISSGLQADTYRGSVANSILYAGGNTYRKQETAEMLESNAATSFTMTAVSDIFEKLPVQGGVYNVDGTNTLEEGGQLAHKVFRNEDGSINMGDILKIKNRSALLGESKPVGADLTKTSWEDYNHFYDDVLVSGDSETLAKLNRAAEALTINCDENGVFQPFDVVNKMQDCKVTWSSSDTSVAVPGTEVDNSAISGAEFITIDIFRDPNTDKTVTLTATISLDGQEVIKTFTLNVKKGASLIGAVSVVTPKGEILGDGESTSTIVDRFDVYKEPTVQVRDALYPDHVKYLKPEQYDYTISYQYQTDASMDPVTVKGFTPSNAGIFTIKVVATLKSDKSQSSMTYKIFVASEFAQVDFNGNSDIAVYQDGFIINGEPGSATGILYAVASKEELNISDPADIVNQTGVQAYPFRATNLSVKFNMKNDAAYNVYYAMANSSGEITSKLYTAKIGAVEVSTAANFKKVAQGASVAGENPSKTIYLLTQDIDLSAESGWTASGVFKGLLNGQGYTVKNLTASKSSDGQASVFANVTGGTVMNVKFSNIKLTNTKNNVGIVGMCNGGYFSNIVLSGVSAKGNQCTAGLIGIIREASFATYISQVYVDETCDMTGSSTRTAGLIGRIYRNGNGTAEVYVTDCLVRAKAEGTGTGVAGFVGEMDANGTAKASEWYIEFNNCVFNGEAYGKNSSFKTAGFIGDQKNLCTVILNNCLNIGKIYYDFNDADLGNVKTLREEAHKNSSGLIGGFVATAKITARNCGSLFAEYNSDISETVNVYDDYQLQNEGLNILTSIMKFDETKWTIVYDSNGATTDAGVKKLETPYLNLKYLEA